MITSIKRKMFINLSFIFAAKFTIYDFRINTCIARLKLRVLFLTAEIFLYLPRKEKEYSRRSSFLISPSCLVHNEITSTAGIWGQRSYGQEKEVDAIVRLRNYLMCFNNSVLFVLIKEIFSYTLPVIL